MAKDVALRELDQSGFRISNLGTPTAAGDATKTDNTAVPKAAAGAGAPGVSLLAAPADHVHPASEVGRPAVVTIVDPSQQSVRGSDEQLVCEVFVDLSGVPSPKLSVAFSAIVKTSGGNATFNVRLGGTPGASDGAVVATMTAASSEFKAEDITTRDVVNPGGHQLLKITAAASNTEATADIRGKHVELRSQP